MYRILGQAKYCQSDTGFRSFSQDFSDWLYAWDSLDVCVDFKHNKRSNHGVSLRGHPLFMIVKVLRLIDNAGMLLVWSLRLWIWPTIFPHRVNSGERIAGKLCSPRVLEVPMYSYIISIDIPKWPEYIICSEGRSLYWGANLWDACVDSLSFGRLSTDYYLLITVNEVFTGKTFPTTV